MKLENKVFVVALMSSYLFGAVQCMDIRQFFNWWFSSSTQATNSMLTASDCKIVNDRRICKFNNAKDLKFDVDDLIELIVDDNSGRTIKCEKKINKFNKWYGSCDGDADDMNIIKRYDEVDGTELIFGSIHVGDDVCRISPNLDDGEVDIDCKPKKSYKAEDAPKKSTGMAVLPPERRRHLNTLFGFTPMSDDNIDDIQSTTLRGYNQTKHRRQLFDDSGSTIDIMVVWTKAAECGNAGMNSGCTLNANTENKMRGLIDLAVEETNTAFELSGVFTSLRLVHAYRDPNYVERGRGDFYSYLEHVTDDGDGNMDSVHEKRALYGADAVQLMVSDDNSCGIAWNGDPTADWMFSVTNYDCATGYYSFGHEVGHNFNLLHDRPTEGTCNEKNTFNYGYRDPNADFRTILSYDCERNGCDNLPKDGCDRIQRFSNSNPQYKYNGKIIGNAQADNARQFNKEKGTVASFYPAMDCQSDSECDDRDSSTVDSCNRDNRVCVFSPGGSVPVRAPVRAPVKAPVRAPTKAPVRGPTKAPVRAPTKAPVRGPTKAPAQVPVRAPARAPVRAPVRTNEPTVVDIPIGQQSSTSAPVNLPRTAAEAFMESVKVTGVTSALWKQVVLTKVYKSPIPVCTIMNDNTATLKPAVVRMQAVGPQSFAIRLQNPGDSALGSRHVHCVIVEEGKWKLPDGRFLEAQKYSSTVTDGKGSYNGQTQTYRNKYVKPVVLGQVMSYNDPKWSVFWSRSASAYLDAPTATSLITGKHVGEDPRKTRLAETIGFIVFESGHAKAGTIEFETGRAADVFFNYVGASNSHSFQTKFASAPVVAVVSQAAMDGIDGSWAVLTSNPTTTSVGIAVDEDQTSDSERFHTTEEVHYAVFSIPGAISLTSV